MVSDDKFGIVMVIREARDLALKGEYDNANDILELAAYSSGRCKSGTLFGRANNDRGFNCIIQGTDHYNDALGSFQNVLTPDASLDIAIPPEQEAIALINAITAKRRLRSDKRSAETYIDLASGLVGKGSYGEALLLDQMGQMNMGKPDQAMSYFEDALKISEKYYSRCVKGGAFRIDEDGYDTADVMKMHAGILMRLGAVGFEGGEYGIGTEFLSRADWIAKKIDDDSLKFETKQTLGKFHLKFGKCTDAMDQFTEAGILAMKLKYKRGIALTSAYLGSYSYKHKERKTANQFFKWVNNFLPELNRDDLEELKKRIVFHAVKKGGEPSKRSQLSRFLDNAYNFYC